MEPLGTTSLFLLACLFFLAFFAVRHRNSGKEQLPPGPFSLPIIGNALQLKTNNLPQTLEKLSEKYGSVFTLHFGTECVVVLHGYEAVKEALIDHGDEFAGRGKLPLAEKVNKGQGLLFSNGERWKQVRRFVLTSLRNLGMGKRCIEERIQEEAQRLLEQIKNTEGKPFDPTFLLSCAPSNVICSVIFGHRYSYNDKRFLHLMHLLDDNMKVFSSPWGQLYTIFPSFMELIPGPHHRILQNFSLMEQFILDEINEHKSTFDPSAPQDVIDYFFIKMKEDCPSVPLDAAANPCHSSLQPSATTIASKKEQNDKSVFTVDSLIATTLDLFGAGTETTSTTLRYGLLILIKYPEIQEKMQEEIDRVVGQTRSPCMADRLQMPFTDAVIHEIQRFISLVPMSLPHTVVKDTPFRQYVIPKGTTIYPLLSSVLHDSTEFPNPKEFDPHHFLNEDGTFRKSNYFMPFSAGKRICAGEGMARMELFLFWTTILQNFTLKPLKDPKTIDITPQFSSFGNVPIVYELCALPR